MNRRETTSWSSWLLLLVGVAGILLIVVWYMLLEDQIDTSYGHRSHVIGGKSVNGTAVLGEMFKQAGHRVHSWRALSPKLRKADVIVWAPDSYDLPSDEVCQWMLDEWYEGDYEPTLIYIGRDFDAEPLYWKKIQPSAPAEQATEVRLRLTDAQSHVQSDRSAALKTTESKWFDLEKKKKSQKVSTLSGEWSDQIDASKVEIELGNHLLPSDEADVLLATEGDALVSREMIETKYAGELMLIVVQNGSFLLNLPLVNHEHRKLAGRLVDEIGPESKNVVFLESGADGPPIRETDPDQRMPTGMEFIGVWPMNYVILHLAVLGVIFCFARLPIFGVPKELPSGAPTDFGLHVAALGRLLEKTNDSGYVTARLRQYQQVSRSETSRQESTKTGRG